MSLDIAPDIRTAILAEPTITGLLSELNGVPAVVTRVPPPAEVDAIYIIVGPAVVVGDTDFVNSEHPLVIRDVFVYGENSRDYRDVEFIGYALRDLFHRKKQSLQPSGYDIIQITAAGPVPAPTDDAKIIGRVVRLTVNMRVTP